MTIVVHQNNTRFAPYDCRFCAYDTDTYDGAEDSSNRSTVGYGHTDGEAIADLLEIMQAEGELTLDEYHEALRAYGVRPVYRGPDRSGE